MKAFLAAGAWFTAAVVLVVGSVVALSWIGFLDRISILFYRGLVLIAVGEVVLLRGSSACTPDMADLARA